MASKNGGRIPYNNPHIRRRLEREAKKLNSVTLVLAVLALLIGLGAGAFAARTVMANDGFSLVGEKTVTYALGEGGGEVTFTDKGATLVAFGRDATGSVSVTTNLEKDGDTYRIDTTEAGVYYLAYTSSSLRYRNVRLVRTVTVEAEGGEV